MRNVLGSLSKTGLVYADGIVEYVSGDEDEHKFFLFSAGSPFYAESINDGFKRNTFFIRSFHDNSVAWNEILCLEETVEILYQLENGWATTRKVRRAFRFANKFVSNG